MSEENYYSDSNGEGSGDVSLQPVGKSKRFSRKTRRGKGNARNQEKEEEEEEEEARFVDDSKTDKGTVTRRPNANVGYGRRKPSSRPSVEGYGDGELMNYDRYGRTEDGREGEGEGGVGGGWEIDRNRNFYDDDDYGDGDVIIYDEELPKQRRLDGRPGETSRLIKKFALRTFRHPFTRISVLVCLMTLDLIMYNEDPVTYSDQEANVFGFGRIYNYYFRRYPPPKEEPLWFCWKLFSLFLWSAIGALIGKYLIHDYVLRDCLDLKLFRKDMGSWTIMIGTSFFFTFVGSSVYNAVITSRLHGKNQLDSAEFLLDDYLGMKEVTFQLLAIVATWLCDYLTTFATVDAMFNDAHNDKKRERKYGCTSATARACRAKWAIGRTYVFFVVFILSSAGLTFFLASDYEYGWITASAGHFGWTEITRCWVAALIMTLDPIVFMQDWDFPRFKKGNNNVKIMGCDSAKRVLRVKKCNNWKLSVNGKWINYIPWMIMCFLNFNLFFNQFSYDPSSYGQIADADDYVRKVFGPAPFPIFPSYDRDDFEGKAPSDPRRFEDRGEGRDRSFYFTSFASEKRKTPPKEPPPKEPPSETTTTTTIATTAIAENVKRADKHSWFDWYPNFYGQMKTKNDTVGGKFYYFYLSCNETLKMGHSYLSSKTLFGFPRSSQSSGGESERSSGNGTMSGSKFGNGRNDGESDGDDDDNEEEGEESCVLCRYRYDYENATDYESSFGNDFFLYNGSVYYPLPKAFSCYNVSYRFDIKYVDAPIEKRLEALMPVLLAFFCFFVSLIVSIYNNSKPSCVTALKKRVSNPVYVQEA